MDTIDFLIKVQQDIDDLITTESARHRDQQDALEKIKEKVFAEALLVTPTNSATGSLDHRLHV